MIPGQWYIWKLSVFAALVASGAVTATGLSETNSPLPPEAKPGECYAKVLVPAKFEDQLETVVKREASEKVTVVPATYRWVEEKVQIREASETFVVTPASYRWVKQRIMIEPQIVVHEPVAAVYQPVTETILDRPAQNIWKRSCGPLQTVEHMTGEVLCLVTEPASFQSITRYIVSEPASTRQVIMPAVIKTIRKQVIDRPAQVTKVAVDAVYETVRVKKLVTPARVERVPVPAEFQVVNRRAMVSPSRLSWVRALCQTDINNSMVVRLQRELANRGYDPGDVNGVLNSTTLSAVDAFQQKEKLASGAITLETLVALQINP